MWPTVEVRWFYPGQVPGQLVAWFRQVVGEPEEQLGRVDHYLRLESTEALGIKMREGRIEIKQRQQRLGLVRFQVGIAGQVEAWRKWSFGLAWAGAFAPPSSWIAVEKKRTLHRVQIGGEGLIVPLPAGSYEAVGCGLELTRIGVGGAIWWSLGLESFGPEATLRDSLMAVAGHLFASGTVPQLEAAVSCGYPRWLQRAAGSNEPC